MTKTIFVNSTKQDAQTKGTTGNIQYIYFSIKPKKVRSQGLSNPVVSTLSAPEVTEGNYGPLNVPVDEPLWCLISTDDRTALGDSVQIKISRTCVWRDHVGSANFS